MIWASDVFAICRVSHTCSIFTLFKPKRTTIYLETIIMWGITFKIRTSYWFLRWTLIKNLLTENTIFNACIIRTTDRSTQITIRFCYTIIQIDLTCVISTEIRSRIRTGYWSTTSSVRTWSIWTSFPSVTTLRGNTFF